MKKLFSLLLSVVMILCVTGSVAFADDFQLDYSSMTNEQLFELALNGVYVDTPHVKTAPANLNLISAASSLPTENEYGVFAISVDRINDTNDGGTMMLLGGVYTVSVSTMPTDYVLRATYGYTYEQDSTSQNMRYVKSFFGMYERIDSQFWITDMTVACSTPFGATSKFISDPVHGQEYKYDYGHPQGAVDVASIIAGMDITYTRNGSYMYHQSFRV